MWDGVGLGDGISNQLPVKATEIIARKERHSNASKLPTFAFREVHRTKSVNLQNHCPILHRRIGHWSLMETYSAPFPVGVKVLPVDSCKETPFDF